MQYTSTRDVQGRAVNAAQAIVQGLAPDGGLFVPDRFPQFSLDDIARMAGQSYADVARDVMAPYLDTFSHAEIADMTRAAYGSNYDHPAIAPLTPIDAQSHFLELYHGPTLAFKDMALQMLPHLLRASLKATGETQNVLILVATSGDTGKAALEGFADSPGTAVVVFYPEGGVSAAQERQMRTQAGANVGVVAVRGNFDDAQTGVKRIFSDAVFAESLAKRGYRLSSANSINLGRLLPQVGYYFWSYANLLAQGNIQLGDRINFVVPTGNFGNILAAYYALRMGLPVNKLICASNRNNVLTDFFAQGRYDKNRPFYVTSSPSMDILVSSNLERLLFELCDRDSQTVRKWMAALQADGHYDIADAQKSTLSRHFWADSCSDQEAGDAIGRVWRDKQLLIDTHTAVAYRVYERYRAETGDDSVSVVVSTASPYKFASDVLQSVAPASDVDGNDPFAVSDALAQATHTPVPERIAALKHEPIRHSDVCDTGDMPDAVMHVLARL